jgi:hypothetical protein
MSTVIKTNVPIPVTTLRAVIGDPDVILDVDLSASKDKVAPLQALIYLSNLELPVDVTFLGEDVLEVVDAYLNLPTLLKCPQLETLVLEVVLHIKGLAECSWVTDQWIKEHLEILGKWLSLIDSMSLYVMTTFQDEKLQSVVDVYPTDDTSDTKGINFVHLFDNPLFPIALGAVNEGLVKNYTKYFNDYMFKSKNLFHFWAIPENDVYLMSLTFSDAEVVTDTEFDGLMSTLKHNHEAIEDA